MRSASAEGDVEHVRLDLRGAIPGGLAAHRRVDGEDQAAFDLAQGRHARGFRQERVDLARRRTLGWELVLGHGETPAAAVFNLLPYPRPLTRLRELARSLRTCRRAEIGLCLRTSRCDRARSLCYHSDSKEI